jgi:xanthine dehydrogenase accessory factor
MPARKHDGDSNFSQRLQHCRALILGGGDVGSAIAHLLFRQHCHVLICERPRSTHMRRGMAFVDALFAGEAVLDGIEAQLQRTVGGIETCWAEARAIPIVTLPEDEVLAALRFDVAVDAVLHRDGITRDLRPMAGLTVGLGPGYTPGLNCHVAVETQWGESMGRVLRDRSAAERSGGPRPLNGITRGRFAIAPAAGVWHTQAELGHAVNAGDVLGKLDDVEICAPISGCLRGVSRDGVEVVEGQRLLEVDPRVIPEVFGLGERPIAIASGVLSALQEKAAVTNAVGA